MAVSDKYQFQRASLVPSFLYSTSSLTSKRSMDTENHFLKSNGLYSESSVSSAGNAGVRRDFVIPAPNEPAGKIKIFSPAYYAVCAVGGALSCGPTHTAVTPLDLVKCNMQVNHSIDAPFTSHFFSSFLFDPFLPWRNLKYSNFSS